MGSLSVKSTENINDRGKYLLQVLEDIKAMDIMLVEGLFEKGKQRIGAEQELCLIDEEGHPALMGPNILDRLDDEHVTTEIGKYNLEINLDPFEIRSDCLRNSERQLIDLLSKVADKASEFDSRILLTGILPTLTHLHLEQDCMSPIERYKILSDTMRAMRGRDFEIHIIGVDEMIASNPSILFEACNTSFQTHLQIDPEEFVDQYNWAQMISAPVLAASTNSPLLFGRELWAETRIALFQQSVDTRACTGHLRNRQSRVYFGNRWLRDSPSEVFKEHLSRFPMVFSTAEVQHSLACLEQGEMPTLKALRLHNGSVYTWNRICYGLSGAAPHLRIECRYIPAGPTIADEMANFAFWLGLLKGMPDHYRDLSEKTSFRSAKDNFYRAARIGLNASFDWFDQKLSAEQLILEELLPIAKVGLEKSGINDSDINRYLGIIEQRVERQQNGAQWQIRNFRRLFDAYGPSIAVHKLTQSMYHQQESGSPVHTWADVDYQKVHHVNMEETIDKVMSTDLFTVDENEPLALVKAIMDWKCIRHLPIENAAGDLVGLVTATNIQVLQAVETNDWEQLPIHHQMVKNIITVTSDTPIQRAIDLMDEHGIGCLPIVKDSKIIGIFTDVDVKRLKEALEKTEE